MRGALQMLAAVAAVMGGCAAQQCTSMPDMRPPPAQRAFVSAAIDAFINQTLPRFKDPLLGQLWANALPNTLDTTVWSVNGQVVKGRRVAAAANGIGGPQPVAATTNRTEIITGDITAMWLRDSANQVVPYLRFVKQDAALAGLIAGLVHRQAEAVLLDPYANAYTVDGGPPSPHLDDATSSASYAGTQVDGAWRGGAG
jgi:meiotically up-regulated gene 157 (Mug157) protein